MFKEQKNPEIRELKERIRRIEGQLEERKTLREKEELIKKEIRNYLQELQKTPDFAPPVATRDEVKEISNLEPSQQVGALISLVFEKGLLRAVSLAQALNNPAILDEFHDTLVDRYFQILIEKGIIKSQNL